MVKDIAMLITVGTGIGGTDEATYSLAHGILYAISQFNPKKIVFFGSNASKKTIESLKIQYENEENEEFNFFEFIEINEIDNFKKYFVEIRSKIQELDENYKIIIDYTSGTKTMTMSAAFASMIYHKKLIFVSGERVNGIVKKGTEELNSQNLYMVYDELLISKIKEFFNTNRFEAGLLLLDEIVGFKEEKEAFFTLLNSYNAFDNVNYFNAKDYFNIKLFTTQWPDLSIMFQKNLKALNIINRKDHNLRCYYILASLLNNARRRSEENKYDDAIARLYRSLELIAQIKLKEYKIITSNVDLNQLKGLVDDNFLSEFSSQFDSSLDKIKIGLTKDFEILNNMGDDLGKFYIKNEKIIKNLLEYRNHSILAHGLNSQNKENYEEFRLIVYDAAKILREDIDDFIFETAFPVFDL